jgi:hypothetical protein
MVSYSAANHKNAFAGQLLTYNLNGNLTSDGTSTCTGNARNQLVAFLPTDQAITQPALIRHY